MNDKNSKRYKLLKKIRDEVISFKKSPLYDYRIKSGGKPVIGEGNHYAKIMFVGEAPGENEARQGRPFCGAAGRVLDELLTSIDIPRSEVYVTNILKDRPLGNRDPSPQEIDLYSPFLERQINIIKPKIVATLGRFSMRFIMERYDLFFELEPISRIHGKVFGAQMEYGQVKIVPLYHPAVALYRANNREILFKDFRILKSLL